MSSTEIFFCNRTYSEEWFDDVKISNPQQHAVIEAIIEAIELTDGGDIDQRDIFERHPDVAKFVVKQDYRIVPANGQQLVH